MSSQVPQPLLPTPLLACSLGLPRASSFLDVSLRSLCGFRISPALLIVPRKLKAGGRRCGCSSRKGAFAAREFFPPSALFLSNRCFRSAFRSTIRELFPGSRRLEVRVFFPQGCISRKGVLPAEPTLPVRPLFPECIPMDDQRIVPRKPKAGGAGVLPAEPTLPVGPLFRECIPIDNQRIVPLCFADQSFSVAAWHRRRAFEPHLNYFAHGDARSTRFQRAPASAAVRCAHLPPRYGLMWPFSALPPTFAVNRTPYVPGKTFEPGTQGEAAERAQLSHRELIRQRGDQNPRP
jgi:hypothetical protein